MPWMEWYTISPIHFAAVSLVAVALVPCFIWVSLIAVLQLSIRAMK